MLTFTINTKQAESVTQKSRKTVWIMAFLLMICFVLLGSGCGGAPVTETVSEKDLEQGSLGVAIDQAIVIFCTGDTTAVYGDVKTPVSITNSRQG